jgi:hypothetical protein
MDRALRYRRSPDKRLTHGCHRIAAQAVDIAAANVEIEHSSR